MSILLIFLLWHRAETYHTLKDLSHRSYTTREAASAKLSTRCPFLSNPVLEGAVNTLPPEGKTRVRTLLRRRGDFDGGQAWLPPGLADGVLGESFTKKYGKVGTFGMCQDLRRAGIPRSWVSALLNHMSWRYQSSYGIYPLMPWAP